MPFTLDFTETKITPSEEEGKLVVEVVLSDSPQEFMAETWLRFRRTIDKYSEQSVWQIQREALAEAVAQLQTLTVHAKRPK